LDRPSQQWALVAACLIVTLVAGAEAVMLRRARVANEALLAGMLEERLNRQQLEVTLGHERAAIGVLSERGATPSAPTTATLTLDPVRSRGPSPPQPTIAPPAPGRVVELRLRLPGAPDPRLV